MSINERIAARFADLKAVERCALVTYITAGDPDPSSTLELMKTLVDAGADIIELGIPFSDPMADGPVIQRASERALDNGMSLAAALKIVASFRESDTSTPIVLMGYLNPLEAMGYAQFAAAARAAGVDGALVVDVPPEEARALNRCLLEHHIDQIFLIAPNSSPERINGVCEFARGFVYYVSVKGVTGAKAVDADEVAARIAGFKQQLTLPVGVGFGIKSAAAAAEVANAGDAVIVGSAIIEIIERDTADKPLMLRNVASFASAMRAAIDGARQA